ncbi:cbb3-type cytochrome c oxidase subunit 3 [Sulfitobacter guttiformis]|uniref:Cytochrome c oxidase cbb3-type subunit 4 n=1 Tax=Sulfitobacter guttiformis TaxID=74349 RepID=A0A420DJF0_9RHOB|nr:cbb3-type cytochrome c oxidase subunit 3 [Sulfitobacter guttiformis]KIN71822.1 Cytochrome c oxidase, Cbb3-type, CcoQ subunit [Sulfitobacter guttiformis KCTC 32187]RKE94363.1 cytochrome c oxidase cbb3-type subunit 4 [Sulfitobacter guttiformis]
MNISHDLLVGLAKSFGLFWLIALSIGITVYAFWPSLGRRFDKAANSILDDEDGPAHHAPVPRTPTSAEDQPCR